MHQVRDRHTDAAAELVPAAGAAVELASRIGDRGLAAPF